jgi:hypothetical protein
MSTARVLAVASERALETMVSLGTPFFARTWGTSRFPAPLHTHGPRLGP